MAIDIGELRAILSLKDTMSPAFGAAEKAVDRFSSSFAAVGQFAGIAIGAIGAVTAGVVALGTRGAEVNDVSEAFGFLTQKAGESADIMLGKMQEGTLGTISNFELMKLANKTMGAGLITSAEDMGTLAAGAKLLADRTGGDTAEAFDKLTSVMASGKTSQLKQLGLFVDSKVALDNYAQSLGKTKGDLSDTERGHGLAAAAIAKLRAQVEQAGKGQADFADNIARGKVAIQNFTDNLGAAIAKSPVLAAGMDAVREAIAEAFGGRQEDAIHTLMGLVNQFAIGLTYVGEGGAVVAEALIQAFYGIKSALATVITGIAALGSGFTYTFAAAADLAAQMPFATDEMKAFAVGAKRGHEEMVGFRDALIEETKASYEGAAGHSAAQEAVGKLSTSMVVIRDKMEAAQGSSDLASKSVEKFGKDSQEAAVRTDESAKAIAASYQKLSDELDSLGRVGLDAKRAKIQQEFEAQVRAIEALKEISTQEKDDQIQLAFEIAEGKIRAAEFAGDEIRAAVQKMEEDISIASITGLESEMLAISQQRNDKIAELELYRDRHAEIYEEMAALVDQKYQQMAEAAVESFVQQTEASVDWNLSEEERAQIALENTKARHQQLLASKLATDDQIKRSEASVHQAQENLDKLSLASKLKNFDIIASAASQTISALFGKNKSAAIAVAIIDAAAAIVKVFAQLGWWGIGPAIAIGVKTGIEIDKIKNTNPAGFAKGTPDMSFLDFGRGSMEMLHGEEAVVTKAGGESLAAMIEDAASGFGSGGGRSTSITTNIEINENPLATYDDRERHREFTLQSVDERQKRNLARQVSLGMA